MDLQAKHHEPEKFIWKYIFSTDHKVIARQFLWGGLIFLAIGGLQAMLIRWQWAYPQEPVPLVGNLILALSVSRVRRLLSSREAVRRTNTVAGALLIGVGLTIPLF